LRGEREFERLRLALSSGMRRIRIKLHGAVLATSAASMMLL
jgi:hypothetical protein